MPESYENRDVMRRSLNHLEDYLYPLTDDLIGMNNLNILSPSSSSVDSQMTGSTPSPMSISTSPHHTMPTYITMNNVTMWGKPHIEIIEQPVDKFRFRYKSEMMGTHGSLAGASSSNSRKKNAPTVELKNYPGIAVIRCTLVTAESKYRGPHAHRLVRRVGNSDEDDPHDITVSPEQGYVAAFHGMGIIHTAKKHIKDELVRKKRSIALEEERLKNINITSLSVRQETSIKIEAETVQKWMNLNSVALCFQAFSQNNNGLLVPITDPVYSNPINNLKSALTGELKICRIDKISGSCDGNEEVFMLVEKVGKKNIKIKFFETNAEDQEIWSDVGRFNELDVHHQYAIVFRTPPYRDPNITEPIEVFIQLYRPTDGDCSEPLRFTYKPNNRIISRKRPRVSYTDEHMPPLCQNMIVDEQLPLLDSSRELSAELKKLIPDGCESDELRNFFDNITPEYLSLLPAEESSNLKIDGRSSKKSKASFAETTVKEIRELIQSGDPDSSNRILALLKERTIYGDSPIHSALRHRELDLVKCMFMVIASNPIYKPIVNSQSSSGRTCLHYAVEQNQPDITKALLLLGADPNVCDDRGFSPLHLAVQIPEAGPCVDVLLEGGDINIDIRDDAGWSAFHLAAEAGSLDAIKSLVKAKVDVNSTDKSYGRTALHIAVEGGHKEIVEFLLEKTTIDVNKRNFSGNTALHSAVVNTGERAKELCQLLLKYKANPSIANHNRESIKESRTTTVKHEPESDDEDDQARDGQTSFDLASNKPEILELLAATSSTESEKALGREVVIKQEIEETDNNFLDEETVSTIAPILDKSGSWEKIAESLGLDYLKSSLKTSPTSQMSPSCMLMNYISLQGDVSTEKLLKTIRTELFELKETKAIKIIDEIILRRTS